MRQPHSNSESSETMLLRTAYLRTVIGFLFCFLLLPSGGFAQTANLDRIVAVVNDEIILASELEMAVNNARQQIRQQQTQPPPGPVLMQQVLDQMVNQRLQVQAAQRAGINVDERTLNQTVRNIAQENNVSMTEFRDILERDGYDFQQFREELRQEILVNRFRQQQIERRVQVTDREIDRFLERQDDGQADREYRLAHILISLPSDPAPDQVEEARARAESVYDELRNGTDFHDAAVAHSDAPDALDGGDLGWRGPAQVPSAFEEVVDRLEPGEFSEPLRSASGFHLVQVVDRRDQDAAMLEEYRVRHILIQDASGARERLQQLRERIVRGEDFADLARSHSDDTGSARQGGELGWISAADVVPSFAEVMSQLEAGELSQPFESRFGWHILEVQEQRTRDATDEQRRLQAREQLRHRKVEEEHQSWVRQLRDEGFVEVRLDDAR